MTQKKNHISYVLKISDCIFITQIEIYLKIKKDSSQNYTGQQVSILTGILMDKAGYI